MIFLAPKTPTRKRSLTTPSIVPEFFDSPSKNSSSGSIDSNPAIVNPPPSPNISQDTIPSLNLERALPLANATTIVSQDSKVTATTSPTVTQDVKTTATSPTSTPSSVVSQDTKYTSTVVTATITLPATSQDSKPSTTPAPQESTQSSTPAVDTTKPSPSSSSTPTPSASSDSIPPIRKLVPTPNSSSDSISSVLTGTLKRVANATTGRSRTNAMKIVTKRVIVKKPVKSEGKILYL